MKADTKRKFERKMVRRRAAGIKKRVRRLAENRRRTQPCRYNPGTGVKGPLPGHYGTQRGRSGPSSSFPPGVLLAALTGKLRRAK